MTRLAILVSSKVDPKFAAEKESTVARLARFGGFFLGLVRNECLTAPVHVDVQDDTERGKAEENLTSKSIGADRVCVEVSDLGASRVSKESR